MKLIASFNNINLLSKLKILISFLLLFILFRMANFNELKNVFQKIDLILFVWLTLIHFFALCLNAYRWKVFIPALKFKQLLKFNLMTFFYNIILPGNSVGEIVKIYKMRSILSVYKVITSVVLERLFSLLTVLMVFGLGIYLSSHQHPKILEFTTVAIILLITFFLCTIKLSSLEFLKGLDYKFISLKLSNNINDGILKFSKNMRYSLTVFAVIINILLGVLAQLSYVLMVMFVSNSIGLNISFFEWCWVYSSIAIALFLPISIAGLGVREGLFVMLVFQLGGKIEDGLIISLSLLIIHLFFSLIGWMLDFNESNLSTA